jgi:hypothetical protein
VNHSLLYKNKQFFFVLIKLSIVTGSFYFIFKKLTHNPELSFSVFVGFLSNNGVFSIKNMTLLLALTLFNWFFEILKWQKLVSVLKKTTFKNALAQSLGALTASLFTPNRIGEYGAKAIYFKSGLRKRIMLVNVLGNMTQMLATTIFGFIGLSFFIMKYEVDINYYKLTKALAVALLTFTIIGLGIKNHTFAIKGFAIEKIKKFILNFSKKALIQTVFLSVLRYFIFSFQFYFLLRVFKVEISYCNAMTLISTMYLLASVIPTIFIFDVVIKGSVAL